MGNTRVGTYTTKEQQRAFYTSSAWAGKHGVRLKALKRDKFECQMCKREGKVTLDSVKVEGERKEIVLNVHHIKEIETHPELALELDNLETLCLDHHNLIHGKTFGGRIDKWKDERW